MDVDSVFDDSLDDEEVVVGYREEAVLTRPDSEVVISWRRDSDSDERIVARYNSESGLLRTFVGVDSPGEAPLSGIVEIQFEVECLRGWSSAMPVGEHERYGTLQLEGLPPGFNGSFKFGLGIARSYREFLRVIEEQTSARVIRFGEPKSEGVIGDVLHLSLTRFEQFRSLVDRNKSRGYTVVGRINRANAHNTFLDIFAMDPVKPTVGRNDVIVAITRELTGDKPLDYEDRKVLVSQLSSEAPVVARESPLAFGKLRDDIELVSLKVLIEQFRRQLGGVGAAQESVWQEFFRMNTFALQQLFAAPVILFRAGQIVDGGNDLGQGQRIADFVLANVVTRTAYVVEIKIPTTRLLGRTYRGKGEAEVHPASHDLAGAVAQVQSQVESIRTELPRLLSRRHSALPLETYSVRAAVVAGKVDGMTNAEMASLRRYRDGLHDVEVVTFDEVLGRLVGLHEALSAGEA